MATVRELVAKFKFDLDSKPIEDFNKTFAKTKQLIGTFAGAKLLGAFSAVGQEMDMIRRNMGLFANELEAIAIVNGMDRVVSSTVDASRAIQNSLEELGDIEFTKKIAQDAEDFAAITGKSIEDVMGMLDQAASGQNISALQSLGLTNQKEVESLQRMNIEMRTATVKQIILDRLAATRVERQKKLGKATKDLDVQQRRFGKIMEDFGLLVAKVINPILSKMLEIFNDIAEFFVKGPIGKFLAQVIGLGGLFLTVLSGIRLLSHAFKILGIVISPVLGFFLAVGAAIAAMGIFVHDLWAAFNDPDSAILFGESGRFKDIISDIKEMIRLYEMLKKAITDALPSAGAGIRNLVGAAEDVNKDYKASPGAYNAATAFPESKPRAVITINANSEAAGKAAGQEVGVQLKKNGISDIETASIKLGARSPIGVGG